MNNIQIFNNEELKLKVRTIQNEDGSISVNAEDTAIGFGWYEEKSEKIYPRWRTINGYIQEFGFSQEVAKDDYIPESLFYMLGMKASNKVAQDFQKWLAAEVIPSIRKTGAYQTHKMSKELQAIFVLDERTERINERLTGLENNMTIDHGQACNVKLAVDLEVRKLCCGNESAAYQNKKLRSKVYRYIWRNIKDYFNVTAYHNLLRKDVDKAINYISNLSLQGGLLREIQEANNQMCFR